MGFKLYVGGLSDSTTSDNLRTHFEQCGTVVSAAVVTERDTARSRGFGFVEMSTQAEADGAIVALNQKSLDGKTLTVNVAKSRMEKSGPRPDRTPRM
jgi:RNA recognition motif-containing protein